MTSQCRHYWKVQSRSHLGSRFEAQERCRCGAVRTRTLSAQESKICRLRDKESSASAKRIHTIYRAFSKRFKDKDDRWKYEGYALMQKIEKWATLFPEDVKLNHIDDSYYANSLLCLIQHRDHKNWHGVTAVVVSQCSGSPPVEFFLYPGDHKSLIKALQEFYRNIPKSQRL